jgi:hypothetical protein
VEESHDFGAEGAVGSEPEIGLNIGEDRCCIVGAGMDLREEQVGVDLAATGDGIEGATFGFRVMAKGKLNQT